MTFWIVLGVIALIAIWLIATYNGLVGGRNQAQTAWSQIDVQLKRRHDLIPNLVQVVKDAMGYEQETLTKVVQARNAAAAATGPAQSGPAEAALSQATRGLFALVESYPQLKANDNVKQLQEELTSTENKIAFSRQFYNDSVNAYNTRRQSFRPCWQRRHWASGRWSSSTCRERARGPQGRAALVRVSGRWPPPRTSSRPRPSIAATRSCCSSC